MLNKAQITTKEFYALLALVLCEIGAIIFPFFRIVFIIYVVFWVSSFGLSGVEYSSCHLINP